MKRAFKIAGYGLLTASALTLAATGMASAKDGHRASDMRGMMRGPQMSFAELDANGDGSLTAEDAAQRAAERFSEADADGDGSVTLQELTDAGVARFEERYQARVNAAAPGQVPGRPSDAQVLAQAERMASGLLRRADTDGDGAISEAEMQAMPGLDRMIARADTDGDGAVSEAEFNAARDEMRSRMERHGDRGPREGHSMRGGERMPQMPNRQ
ncbi:MAG: EF-hand domain-containing protein [Pseudomonadota bacterium]|nr:EF-hand domain-containing protein [Pseudomonadota bacterium]